MGSVEGCGRRRSGGGIERGEDVERGKRRIDVVPVAGRLPGASFAPRALRSDDSSLTGKPGPNPCPGHCVNVLRRNRGSSSFPLLDVATDDKGRESSSVRFTRRPQAHSHRRKNNRRSTDRRDRRKSLWLSQEIHKTVRRQSSFESNLLK